MNSEKEKKSKQIAKPKVENIGQNPPPYSPVHATAREIPKSAEWQEGKDRNNAQTDRRTKRRSDGKKKRAYDHPSSGVYIVVIVSASVVRIFMDHDNISVMDESLVDEASY